MFQKLLKGFRTSYNNVINSIAFLPALITIGFLILSFLLILFDYSETGKSLKAGLHWLKLRDATTARSICTTIAGGVISLAVFSFSMVMIILNQAASQLSNRILGKLIGNRYQQIVLGFYIGTIIYALFLLSTIRDIDSGIYVPSISTYFLILCTVLDIFLFLYFLHYITDSVKYESIIGKIQEETHANMVSACNDSHESSDFAPTDTSLILYAQKSGIFQGIDQNPMLSICQSHKVVLSFIHGVGTYVLKGTPVFYLSGVAFMPKDFNDRVAMYTNIGPGQLIAVDFYNGFRQLMEIALKALSPGINDPDTAVLALRALFDLLAFRLSNAIGTQLRDSDNAVRIITVQKTTRQIVEEFVLPILDYGKNDRLIISEFKHLLQLIERYKTLPEIQELQQRVTAAARLIN